MRLIGRVMMVVVLCGAALAACAPVRYQPPANGPVSPVRFVTLTDDVAVVRQYDDLKCSNEREMLRVRNAFLLRDEKRDMGIPLNTYRSEAAKEVPIQAGIPFRAMFYGSRSGYTHVLCGVMIDYTFQEGHSYELVYSLEKSVCMVELNEIVTDASGPRKEYLRHFLPIVPSPECKKVFGSSRLF